MIKTKDEISVIANGVKQSTSPPTSTQKGREQFSPFGGVRGGRLLRALALAMTAALILPACTEPITIKTNDSPPVIVIYSELTDEFKHQEIKITRSSPYFDNQPNEGVSQAQVVVSSSEGETFRFLENDSIQGLYLSQNKFGVRSGVSYNLSVTVDFNHDGVPDEYQASTTVLPAVVPDSLSLDSVEIFGHTRYILYAYFQDPPEENYYLFHVFQNDSLLTNQISKYIVSDDALFNGQFVSANVFMFRDVSEWETDSEDERKRSAYLNPGDIVGTEISEIPKGYYDFINQCQREQDGENPMFGGPASNITTNISNGGVGYFVGYCVVRKSIAFQNEI